MNDFKLYLAVGIGGIIGAVARYGISLFLGTGDGFPTETLVVNLLGCFCLSFLLNKRMIKQILSPEVFAALSIGLIGSFTTFSTVTVETIELWTANSALAIGYVIVSFFGGLLFCYGGYKLGRRGQVN